MGLHLFVPFSAKRPPAGGLRKALGPSWTRTPVRRAVQAACLGTFLVLLLYVGKPFGARQWAEAFARREVVEAEAFLLLDPLVGVSAAMAARTWTRALLPAAAVLGLCLIAPRVFCGYLCPLGTLIDLFDWAVGKRLGRWHLRPRGWWVHLRYLLLLAGLVAAAGGTLLAGFLAALPIATRGLAFAAGPLQVGLMRGSPAVGPLTPAHFAGIVPLVIVCGLGLLGRRFWCRCLCPSGALLSLASLLRLTDRKVTSSCVECGRCAEACSFGAVRADFTTRPADCTFCQECGAVCPTGAIQFVGRWKKLDLKAPHRPPPARAGVSRRGFLAGGLAATAAGLGIGRLFGLFRPAGAPAPVRPPGSVPERDFLRTCVRCGECVHSCPTGVLRASSLGAGPDGLWTPRADTDVSGCDPTCNLCGQVCPTGAIRALPLAEKRAARMGLAVVNEKTCLPWAGRQDCRMCVDACKSAGYEAIEFRLVRPELDELGLPIDGSGFLAPAVLADKCVGCGLCQTRCNAVNVRAEGLLAEPAISVHAGPGREDRIRRGSYRALKRRRGRQEPGTEVDYAPDPPG